MALWVIIGCATVNPPAFRQTPFAEASAVGKTLLVLPLADVQLQNKATLRVHYKRDLREITAPDPEKVLVYRLMCRSLRKYVANAFVQCDESLVLNPENVRDTLLPTWSPTVPPTDSGAMNTFFIPRRSVLNLENSPDYILFIAKPAFTSWIIHPKQEEMTFTGSYVILDYREGTVVGYGHLKTSGSYPVSSSSGAKVGEPAPESRRYQMPRNLWPHVLDRSAVQIVRESPFEGEEARKYLKYLKGIW